MCVCVCVCACVCVFEYLGVRVLAYVRVNVTVSLCVGGSIHRFKTSEIRKSRLHLFKLYVEASQIRNMRTCTRIRVAVEQ